MNQTFATDFLGGRSAVGQLVRPFAAGPGGAEEWTEIIGVVPNEAIGSGRMGPAILFPLVDGTTYPLRIFMRLERDAAAFGSRLRSIAADAAPGLLLDELYTIGDVRRGEVVSQQFFVVLFVFVAAVTLLLSITGIYALMSFIVSQRTREIGIRTALGADARLVVRGVFARALVQLAAGAVVGVVIASIVRRSANPVYVTEAWVTVGSVCLLLVLVGMVACIVPVSRGLRVQPTEALRAEG